MRWAGPALRCRHRGGATSAWLHPREAETALEGAQEARGHRVPTGSAAAVLPALWPAPSPGGWRTPDSKGLVASSTATESQPAPLPGTWGLRNEKPSHV